MNWIQASNGISANTSVFQAKKIHLALPRQALERHVDAGPQQRAGVAPRHGQNLRPKIPDRSA